MSDEPIASLLSEVAGQNRAAFCTLYTATSAKLFAVLLAMLRERAEAEDALQDVYLKIWRHAAGYDARKGTGMTWLICVARNVAIDRLRARRHSHFGDEAVIDALPARGANIETRMIAADDARHVLFCLKSLEPATAAALQGAYLFGLSYADLAVRHNVPINTMRTLLRRGLLKLKKVA